MVPHTAADRGGPAAMRIAAAMILSDSIHKVSFSHSHRGVRGLAAGCRALGAGPGAGRHMGLERSFGTRTK